MYLESCFSFQLSLTGALQELGTLQHLHCAWKTGVMVVVFFSPCYFIVVLLFRCINSALVAENRLSAELGYSCLIVIYAAISCPLIGNIGRERTAHGRPRNVIGI